MSSIFLTSEFKNLLNDNQATETLSVSKVLNKYTKSNNNDKHIASTTVNNGSESSNVKFNGSIFSATSSAVPTNGNDVSVTSSAIPTNGNDVSATSSLNMTGGNRINKNDAKGDVDSLVAMLTSTDSHTQTDELETKLKGLLNNKVGGGNNELSNVKQFFHNLKSNGVKVDLKLNDLTLSDFFNTNNMRKNMAGGAEDVHVAAPPVHEPSPVTVPVPVSAPSPVSVHDAIEEPHESTNLIGGRDLPPALVAFQKIRSFIAKELDLKGIKVSAKVASALKKEVAGKNPKADPMEIADIAIKYFKDNKEKYEKLANSLA
jgi:hypothetical protein